MAYTKHNFVSGDILYATQMKEIDNQVYELTNDTVALGGLIANLDAKTEPATDAEVRAMLESIFGN